MIARRRSCTGKIAENFALLGFYAASSDNFLPTFRDVFPVPSSGFKNPKESLFSGNGVYTGKSVGGEMSQQYGVSQ